MSQRPVVFVDSATAAIAARDRQPTSIVVTDNPLLAQYSPNHANITDISGGLSQIETSDLGRAAVDILLAIDRKLTAAGTAMRYGARVPKLNITLITRSLLATLFHRGLLIHRALDKQPASRLVLAVLDQPRWPVAHPWTMQRFGSPHRALAEHGFFGALPVSTEIVATPLPKTVNDTATDDWVLRLAAQPTSSLIYEFALRSGLVKFLPRQGVVVGKQCEALRETLPWLTLSGHRLPRLEIPPYTPAPPPPFGTVPQQDQTLAEFIAPEMRAAITALDLFTPPQAAAITDVFLDHFSAGMATLRTTIQDLENRLDAAFSNATSPKTLITSGIYGPLGTQLHALCKERQIRLVDFEHGATTGIAATSQRRLGVSEATTCDLLLTTSREAKKVFSRITQSNHPAIEVIGLPVQAKQALRPRLQRWRARRRLALAPHEPALLHVSTLIYGGNMRPGDDCPSEHHVFATDRRLITEVYPDLPYKVFFKRYPTQRYIYEPDYDEIFDLHANVNLLTSEDFRYMRSAADIIVTQANSSTIGWCVGTGVPIIHLASRQANALASEELYDAFQDAFLVVDADDPTWPSTLRDLLSGGMARINQEWRQKATTRRDFVEAVLTGPTGNSGRRAAQQILQA